MKLLSVSKFALLSTTSILAFGLPVLAAESQTASETVEEVIVTGSRIERAGYEAPTPVTMANADEIMAQAPPSLGEYLGRMPAFSSTIGERSPNKNTSGAQAGSSLVDLRGAGFLRTLVLFNGRRVASSNALGGVDMNLIPDSLVQRIDIVTGGASAAWGSDALAGVVNVITNNEFIGVELKAEAGISSYGDIFTHRQDVTAGSPFHGGRGHVVASYSHYSMPNYTFLSDKRGWATNRTALIPNPVAGGSPRLVLAGTGIPGYTGPQGPGYTVGTSGGLITGGPLKNIQFIGDGVATPYRIDAAVGSLTVGKDAEQFYLNENPEVTPVERHTLYSHTSYAVTDTINAELELSYSDTRAQFYTIYFPIGGVNIRNDNAFLPATVRTAMAANNITTFPMSIVNRNLGHVGSDVSRRMWRGVIGFDGKFLEDWTWRAYYERGQARTRNTLFGNPHRARYNYAVDAVVNPATGGIVCRETLALNPNPESRGCAPLNVFGNFVASQAAIDYINSPGIEPREHFYITQDVGAVSIAGSPVASWAGPVDVVAGFEMRRDGIRGATDSRSPNREFFAGNFSPFPKAAVNVKEGFGEINVPLAKDQSWARSLDLNGAIRVTDYSTSGTVVTWKAGLAYQATDEVRLRATRSRDIRAPTLSEFYAPGRFSSVNTFDPVKQVTALHFRSESGNVNLTPEKGDTTTIGGVYSPMWLEGFQTSIDYYSIKVTDAILTPSVIVAVQGCFEGNQTYCATIQRNAAGDIDTVFSIPVNVASEKISGIDMEASYSTSIGPGEASFRVVGTYLLEQSTIRNGLYFDAAGSVTTATPSTISGNPKLKLNANLNYDWDAISFALLVRMLGPAKMNAAWTSADVADSVNNVPAQVYFGINAGYDFEVLGTQSNVFMSIQNILDKDPPITPTVYTGGGALPNIYDAWGRMFRAGLRVKF